MLADNTLYLSSDALEALLDFEFFTSFLSSPNASTFFFMLGGTTDKIHFAKELRCFW